MSVYNVPELTKLTFKLPLLVSTLTSPVITPILKLPLTPVEAKSPTSLSQLILVVELFSEDEITKSPVKEPTLIFGDSILSSDGVKERVFAVTLSK